MLRSLQVAILVGLTLLASGCQRPIDTAAATSNAAAAGLRHAHGRLSTEYRAAQVTAAKRVQGDRTDPVVRAEQHDRVSAVRATWRRAWNAYGLARAAWVELAAGVQVARQAEDAGGVPPLGALFSSVVRMAAAHRGLIVAFETLLKDEPPPLPPPAGGAS
jgi:hypothetical protein